MPWHGLLTERGELADGRLDDLVDAWVGEVRRRLLRRAVEVSRVSGAGERIGSCLAGAADVVQDVVDQWRATTRRRLRRTRLETLEMRKAAIVLEGLGATARSRAARRAAETDRGPDRTGWSEAVAIVESTTHEVVRDVRAQQGRRAEESARAGDAVSC